MTKHIVIILFDFSKFQDSDPLIGPAIENDLKNRKANDFIETYYLKIDTKTSSDVKDKLYKLTKQINNKSELIEQCGEYDFTDGNDLKKVFELIKTNFQEDDLKWYFISIGHGSGFSFFNHTNKQELFFAPPQVAEIKLRALYIKEIIDASSDLGAFPFELGLFYNCNVTTMDNCFLLSKKFKYVIGCENFNTNAFVSIKLFMDSLEQRISSRTDVHHFVRQFYNINIDNATNIVYNSTVLKPLRGAAIFCIKLDDFAIWLDYMNTISMEIVKLFEIKQFRDTTYWKLRKVLSNSRPAPSFIDLFSLLAEIKKTKEASGNKILASNISTIESQREKIIIGDRIILNPTLAQSINLQGISLYLPEFSDGYSGYYTDAMEARQILKNNNWYFVVDIVVKLYAPKNFFTRFFKAITSFFR